MGVFDHFESLNDLIQVIYHSTSCFVLISSVDSARWTVELALVEEASRWWRGSWTESDVYKLAGSEVSEKALESFAVRLANWIVIGELAISDWSPEDASEMMLRFDPSGNAPVVVSLRELPAEESSSQAINILKRIALQAQSRQCRIDGPIKPPPKPTSSKLSSPKPSKPERDLKRAQEEIKRLQREVDHAKQVVAESTTTSQHDPVAPAKPPPGASRVNPARQKRKLVEVEFESD